MNKLFLALACAIVMASCEKNDVKLTPLSSLTIANAVAGTSELKLGSNNLSTPFMGAGQYTLIAGNNNLYIWPVGDSAHPVYNQPLEMKNGHIYTLFLAGDIAGTVDPVLIEEDLPVHTDSTAGVRFINLLKDGPHVSIKRSTKVEDEISDLEYQEKSWFFMYPAKSEDVEYAFTIYDNSNGNILSEYNLSTPRFKNVTLAITGSAETGYNVVQVNHY